MKPRPVERSPEEKRRAAKKAAAASKPAKKRIESAPEGYAPNPRGRILVPTGSGVGAITPASKLRDGLQRAHQEIKDSLHEMASILSTDFEISEVEVSMSFSAEGKFLGFGVGGATSIKVKIRPVLSAQRDA